MNRTGWRAAAVAGDARVSRPTSQTFHPEETIPASIRVGFIGLGLMGMPMARNLMRAGYPVTAHNRSAAKTAAIAAEGAVAAASPREAGERSDVVVTILPTEREVEQVVTGQHGVIEGLAPGGLVIDMSSISPLATLRIGDRLQEAGCSMLDAPVSGGDLGAIAGTLSIMVGGAESDFNRALPLFRAMGRTITHVGGRGAGQTTKAANQVVVGLTIAAVAEALTLGRAGGVAPEKLLAVLAGGLAANQVIEVKREKLLSHHFPPGGRAELHLKDLGIAVSLAREWGVTLPHTAVLEQLFRAMKQKGWGAEDHTALVRLIEDLSGMTVEAEKTAAG